MARAKDYPKCIFCLETEWSDNFVDEIGVISILRFLKEVKQIEYIHRRCATLGELKHYLQKLVDYQDYSLFYLAFHGSSNSIWIENQELTLNELAEVEKGAFKDKIVHFGSCETIKLETIQMNEFIKKTEALVVSGYTKKIDFIPSAAFDILYFETCQNYKDTKAMEKHIFANYGAFADSLGFKIFHR